jgi:hypothetical protein
MLPKIDFESLNEGERLAYQFFSYLLFNKKYSIKLEPENLERLKEDSKYYWEYFGQIHELLGYEK